MSTGATTLRWASGPADLTGALRVREVVFCDEQGVPVEEEVDGRDQEALHLVALAPHEDQVVGTLRLLFHRDTVKVGRVAVLREWRRRGIASAMLELALRRSRELGSTSARLASQVDAVAVYERAGFEVCSEEFEEAGIPHVWMELAL
jgi:predicted GNAT family N-acyltransferase